MLSRDQGQPVEMPTASTSSAVSAASMASCSARSARKQAWTCRATARPMATMAAGSISYLLTGLAARVMPARAGSASRALGVG